MANFEMFHLKISSSIKPLFLKNALLFYILSAVCLLFGLITGLAKMIPMKELKAVRNWSLQFATLAAFLSAIGIYSPLINMVSQKSIILIIYRYLPN